MPFGWKGQPGVNPSSHKEITLIQHAYHQEAQTWLQVTCHALRTDTKINASAFKIPPGISRCYIEILCFFHYFLLVKNHVHITSFIIRTLPNLNNYGFLRCKNVFFFFSSLYHLVPTLSWIYHVFWSSVLNCL